MDQIDCEIPMFRSAIFATLNDMQMLMKMLV